MPGPDALASQTTPAPGMPRSLPCGTPAAAQAMAQRASGGLAVAVLAVALTLAGCSWFRSTPSTQATPAGAGGAAGDPFADGVLRAVAAKAPPGSVSQYLAGIADQLGWEAQLTQNTLLRQSILDNQFEQRVQPYLLALYFRNGYSVLPTVGDGHQVNRDTIIRGVAGDNRLFVATRNTVRIIFLGPVQNVQVIYPQDGAEPQVFTIDKGVVAVRRSLSPQYLR